MCGIAGIIGNFEHSDLETIEISLKHRGPDKQSIFKRNDPGNTTTKGSPKKMIGGT